MTTKTTRRIFENGEMHEDVIYVYIYMFLALLFLMLFAHIYICGNYVSNDKSAPKERGSNYVLCT